MRILIVINSFKGTISSLEASRIIAKEIKKILKKPKLILQPVSDGGDGFIDSLKTKKIKIISQKVTGPVYKKVLAKYILKGKNAYIEIAQACGIKYLKKTELSPLKATSYGVGELIRGAIKKGAKYIFLGLGGTASSDGGYGMAKALGFKFIDKNGKEIKDSVTNYTNIEKIIPPQNRILNKIKFFAITDVKNPLIGKNGSARIFGPQKGATQRQVLIIERNLRHLAIKIKKLNKKDVSKLKGGGAAGGLGAGLAGFLNAKILLGAKFIVKKLKLREKIKTSDIIITGEGKFDKTSFMGKITGEIYEMTKKEKKKIILISAQDNTNIKNSNMLKIILGNYFPEKYCLKTPKNAIVKTLKINKEKIKEFVYKNSKIS